MLEAIGLPDLNEALHHGVRDVSLDSVAIPEWFGFLASVDRFSMTDDRFGLDQRTSPTKVRFRLSDSLVLKAATAPGGKDPCSAGRSLDGQRSDGLNEAGVGCPLLRELIDNWNP